MTKAVSVSMSVDVRRQNPAGKQQARIERQLAIHMPYRTQVRLLMPGWTSSQMPPLSRDATLLPWILQEISISPLNGILANVASSSNVDRDGRLVLPGLLGRDVHVKDGTPKVQVAVALDLISGLNILATGSDGN